MTTTQATPQLSARFIEATQELPYKQLPFALKQLSKVINECDWENDPDFQRLLDESWNQAWHEYLAKKSQFSFPPVEAKRLQEISGLSLSQLAEIFAVSPETYSQWQIGFPLASQCCERLATILKEMEETNHRLGSAEATKAWLLTPIEEGGKTPLSYLIAGRDGTFGGFVLSLPTGQEVFGPLVSSTGWVNAFMTPDEFEANLERTRPRVYLDDEDYDIDESRVDMSQKIRKGI